MEDTVGTEGILQVFTEILWVLREYCGHKGDIVGTKEILKGYCGY